MAIVWPFVRSRTMPSVMVIRPEIFTESCNNRKCHALWPRSCLIACIQIRNQAGHFTCKGLTLATCTKSAAESHNAAYLMLVSTCSEATMWVAISFGVCNHFINSTMLWGSRPRWLQQPAFCISDRFSVRTQSLGALIVAVLLMLQHA